MATFFLPWDWFDGYRETDGAVVLERRWGFDERMAAAEVPADAREADGSRPGDGSIDRGRDPHVDRPDDNFDRDQRPERS